MRRTMSDSMNDFLDNFFGLSVMDRPLLGDFNLSNLPTNSMRTDVLEKENSYELSVDLPGFKKEDVKIELVDNMLEISAETSSENEEKKDGKYIRRERYQGRQVRRMMVPEGTKQEDIKASFENGVLKIELPKPEEVKPEKKMIEIK